MIPADQVLMSLRRTKVFVLSIKSDDSSMGDCASPEANGKHYVATDLERDHRGAWKKLILRRGNALAAAAIGAREDNCGSARVSIRDT